MSNAYRPSNTWPNTPMGQGVKFVAQIWREMLDPKTFESFRAYTLDTSARIDEVLMVLKDVERGRVPYATVEPAIEELIWSLKKDPAISHHFNFEVEEFKKMISKGKISSTTLSGFSGILTSVIKSRYREYLLREISDNISNPKGRNSLRKSAGFLLSNLINSGYRKSYISQQLENRFFKSNHKKLGSQTIQRFLLQFNGERNRYRVYIPVSNDFSKLLDQLEFVILSPSKLPAQISPNVVQMLTQNPNAKFVDLHVESLDPHAALAAARDQLSTVRAIAQLDPRPMDCEWGNVAAVRKEKAQSISVLTLNEIDWGLHGPQSVPTTRRRKSVQQYAKRIANSFNDESHERLMSAISMISLARDASAFENRLITVWSAIEVLLSEPVSGPRIVHLSNEFVPCVVGRHFHRKIKYLHDMLSIVYRQKFRLIMKAVPEADLALDSLICALCLPHHQVARDDLISLSKGNPLMMHRLYCVQRDVESPKSLLKAIEEHDRRVRWQVNRIYRARNGLVHSGRVPLYLDSLTANATEYFTSALATIIREGSYDEARTSIDSALAQSKMRHELNISYMKSLPDQSNWRADGVIRVLI